MLTFVKKESSAGDDTVAVQPLLQQATFLCVDARLELFPRKRAVTRWFA